MPSQKCVVRVSARDGVDVQKLAGPESPLEVPCGSVGPLIARDVLAGKGKAMISLSTLRTATDTQEGVEAIFDHFVLSDAKTGEPLFYALAKESLASA